MVTSHVTRMIEWHSWWSDKGDHTLWPWSARAMFSPHFFRWHFPGEPGLLIILYWWGLLWSFYIFQKSAQNYPPSRGGSRSYLALVLQPRRPCMLYALSCFSRAVFSFRSSDFSHNSSRSNSFIFFLSLSLSFVGTSKIIKNLVLSLHQGFQHVVHKGYNGLIPVFLGSFIQTGKHHWQNFISILFNQSKNTFIIREVQYSLCNPKMRTGDTLGYLLKKGSSRFLNCVGSMMSKISLIFSKNITSFWLHVLAKILAVLW